MAKMDEENVQRDDFYPTEKVEEEVVPSPTSTVVDEPKLQRTPTGRQFAPINAHDRQELTRLATQMSSVRPSASRNESLRRTETYDLEYDDPVLDPSSNSFDLYKWLKKTIHTFDEEGVQTKRAGIVFKDLNVSGSGAALQFQQTVLDIFLAPIRIGEMLGSGRKQHKQIIRNFNGVLKSGELLIVLGRPGSGCSTFLKSLCGELHGLNVNKGSVIHYNGT